VGGEFLALVVTPATRQRALSIADGFLTAVEQRGFKVKLEEGKTLISCKDIAVHFRMSEMAKKAREGYSSDTWDALGRLRIILRSATYASAAPSEIKARDEDDKRLEDQLNELLARLRRSIVGYEEREIRRKNAALAAEIAARRQEAHRWHDDIATAAARREKEILDAALAEAQQWEVAERIRRYIDHVEQRGRARGMSTENGSALGEWLVSLRRATEYYDPVDGRLDGLDPR